MGTNVREVLIVMGCHLLFGAGLQGILTRRSDIHVRGVSPVSRDELLQEIDRSRPEVVILDATVPLLNPVDLLACLEAHPSLRLLVVSLHDNVVRVYGHQQVLVTSMDDLDGLLCCSPEGKV